MSSAAPASSVPQPDLVADSVAELFRRLDQSTGEEETGFLTGALVKALGFTYFSYGMPWRTAGCGRPNDFGMLLTSYPEGWQNHYRRQGYHATDAVILQARMARRPFGWGHESYLLDLEPEARRPFLESRDFGIASGITIPVHGPHNMSGGFSVSGPEEQQPVTDVGDPTFRALLAVAQTVHTQIVHWHSSPASAAVVKLSERERLCLQWTTQGKTAWEIAQIIGRSKATVDFHLRRATAKLTASNKVHAAFKALELDLL